jgi:D-threo-aldose 1-dehydrogenase
MTRFVETDLFEVAISHNRYTLINREAEPFWDVCHRHHVAAVNAAPYGGGMLAKGPSVYSRYMYAEADTQVLEQAFQIEHLCQRYQVPLAAHPRNYCWDKPPRTFNRDIDPGKLGYP